MTALIRLVASSLPLVVACSSGSDTQPPPGGSADGERSEFYVANTNSGTISVIDHRLGSVVDTIDVGNKPHGHAPAKGGARLYATTDGGRGEVIAINTADHSIDWRIEVGSDLNEPHLTRDDRFLYAPDLLAAKVIVVDVEARAVSAEVEMVDEQGTPLLALHNTYASHDGRFMYVTAILSQAIARIDPQKNVVDRIYHLSGDPRPAAITHDDARMYVQLSGLHGFIELDLATGEETRRIEWPEPATPPAGSENETIATKCHGIGITPDGTELWAATNLEGAVHVYSLPALERLGKVEVGEWPNWIAFSSDGESAYVTNTELAREHGTVSVVDVASRAVTRTLDVGGFPKRIHRVDLPE